MSAHRLTVVAIIPVGTLEGAKSRLGAVLDAEERQDLVRGLARRTIAAAVAAQGVDETLVVTPDDAVREIALEAGARPLRQRTSGLNDGLREARAEAQAAGADAILVLPIDLPEVTSTAIDAVLARLPPADAAGGTDGRWAAGARPTVVIVPDRHGRGTNALLLRPPDAIEFCFGGDSRDAHRAAARAAGAELIELDGPLALDLDTADDLVLAETTHPELVRG